MYAIVEIQGQQFKAEAGKFLYVHYLGDATKAGETVEFDRVLLVDADGAVKVGVPTVEGAKVVCEVASHLANYGGGEAEETTLFKGDKVIVFKKKRRKGYRRKNGHRQYFSKLVIKEIVA
ncbi:MAG: 50S ribosomal protein L21 [Muribaculaceae bacterium]|nr:50S ribosomal protein L21 [Muribaculaceae bacterium]MDE5929743.1 50S ribosomal protein L21 [Muribaculaceae bacterium]